MRFDYGSWRTFANYLAILTIALLLGLILFWIWNKKLKKDKAKIEALLGERQTMIKTLLKANKTAATGALSAAIAHELNQTSSSK